MQKLISLFISNCKGGEETETCLNLDKHNIKYNVTYLFMYCIINVVCMFIGPNAVTNSHA